jgi:hypothetical protein
MILEVIEHLTSWVDGSFNSSGDKGAICTQQQQN